MTDSDASPRGQVAGGPGGSQGRWRCASGSPGLWHLAGPFPGSGLGGGAGAGPGPPLLLASQVACSPLRSQWEVSLQLPRCAARHQVPVHSSAAEFAAVMGKSPPSRVLRVLSCTLGTAGLPTTQAGVGCSGDDGAGGALASVINVSLEKDQMSEGDFGCLLRIWPHPSW